MSSVPKDWRELDLPAKVRLRWRLRARPKQLTPKRHTLCANEEHECEKLLIAVQIALPDEESALAYLSREKSDDPDDEGDPLGEARLAWLAERGHYDWLIWLILAGRGWGKTRTGAEDVVKFALEHPGSRIALVAATYADGRDTMVEGESGILGILPKSLIQDWNRSIGELILTNGSTMKIFTAEKPERLRGPQHHRAWADELAAWEYLQETWDMMMFGLRLGELPQVIITTTPKPLRFIRKLIARSRTKAGGVVVTSGSTFENAKNLARTALQELKETYLGTKMGRQELYAEVLDEIEGALWTQANIDDHRVELYMAPNVMEDLGRVVVGVDPAVTSKETSDSNGIVIAGVTKGPCPYCHRAEQPHVVVLEDATIGRASPNTWANRVAAKYREWRADRVVPEVNNGGELVETVMQAAHPNLPVKAVHASRGKTKRAEPVAALYEKGKVHHLGNGFAQLEDQMTTWVQDDKEAESPDRMDALVWAITDLMLPSEPTRKVGQAADHRHKGRR
jgi:phage terminase large subunit-like protein